MNKWPRYISFRNYFAFLLILGFSVSALQIQGCATQGYEGVDTTRKAILVATAEVRGANLLLQDLVKRNAIDRDSAVTTLNSLREASAALQLALNAVDVAGDPVTAVDNLQRANAAITIALTLLSQFGGDST